MSNKSFTKKEENVYDFQYSYWMSLYKKQRGGGSSGTGGPCVQMTWSAIDKEKERKKKETIELIERLQLNKKQKGDNEYA